ncbi:hypothetical protein G6F63_014646 [Rhizopus arrhizus]|nr:hypothetical protein G6F63_014646 [Rhizopus arrhizus]
MQAHVLDGPQAVELAQDAQAGQHRAGVMQRRVGQQHLAAGQLPQLVGQRLFGAHPRVDVEVVAAVQEVMRVHAVMPTHADHRGAVALPVQPSHVVGRVDVDIQGLGHGHRHAVVDLGEDGVRGVVEGIVQIEQPQAFGNARGRSARAAHAHRRPQQLPARQHQRRPLAGSA